MRSSTELGQSAVASEAPSQVDADRRQVTEAYNVADLLADPAVLTEAGAGEAPDGAKPDLPSPMARLIRVLTMTVQPDEWAENGGELGRTSVFGSTLVVTAPPAMQNDVRDVLAKLRAAQASGQGENSSKSRK